MIILIGNQKGGTGKSTLTLLMANYLTQVKKRLLTVVDMDEQQHLLAKAQRAMILENKPAYPIFGTLNAAQLLSGAAPLPDRPREIVLIDMASKLSDDQISLIARADMICCPFAYDEFSMPPTLLFALVCRKINPGLPFVFIPNRIKGSVSYGTKLESDKALQAFGGVTPGLADKVDFQRITTFHTPNALHALAFPVLDLIYEHYILKNEK